MYYVRNVLKGTKKCANNTERYQFTARIDHDKQNDILKIYGKFVVRKVQSVLNNTKNKTIFSDFGTQSLDIMIKG